MARRLLLAVAVVGVAPLAAPAADRSAEAATSQKPAVLEAVPKAVEPDARYLLYLHGRIIEEQGLRPEHPRFGVYEYELILETLAGRGLVVISQPRPKGTRIGPYAEQVRAQVEGLLEGGVPADHITVAGHSKGGIIAVFASALIARPQVSFVFLACCGEWLEAPDAPRPSGRLLSIYEASDELGRSCRPAFEHAGKGSTHAEIEIAIGGGHGAFYRPHPEWIDPLVEWARGPRPREKQP